MPYAHDFELATPFPVSAVSFGADGQLAVGSEDGSVRIFDLPSPRVVRAIRALGEDVASLSWIHSKTSAHASLWVASGRKAHLFDIGIDKLILGPTDALKTIELGEDDEDVINELNVNDNKKILAFSTDAGTVGVVDLASITITRMKTIHTIKFVPDRPSEILSGGYDSALIHFDFKQNTVLSRLDIAAAPPSSGVSLSPPFILSTCLSPSGLVAATTADGRLWIGSGGDKSAPSADKKKRSRKWQGLKESEGAFVQIADGPVVSSACASRGVSVLTSTLLGKLAQHDIVYNDQAQVQIQTVWAAEVKTLAKVNALAVQGEWLVIGGINKDGKGVAEIWRRSDADAPAEQLSQLSL